MKYNRER